MGKKISGGRKNKKNTKAAKFDKVNRKYKRELIAKKNKLDIEERNRGIKPLNKQMKGVITRSKIEKKRNNLIIGRMKRTNPKDSIEIRIEVVKGKMKRRGIKQ